MTTLVVRMTIVSDATTWSIIYDHHSDDFYIFIIQFSGEGKERWERKGERERERERNLKRSDKIRMKKN